jgi:hypothetical protein
MKTDLIPRRTVLKGLGAVMAMRLERLIMS